MPKQNLLKPPTLKRGPVKHSKRVTDRLKAAARLNGRINRLKALAAEGFCDKLAAELRDGEAMPDMTLSLELIGRSVKTAVNLLEQADRDYCGQAVTRRFLQDACVYTAAHETYPELVEVRQSIDQRFGHEAGRRVHQMTEPTRRKPKRQLPQLDGLVGVLESDRPLPAPLRPGRSDKREEWLAQLKPGYEKLTRMMAELEGAELREERLRKDRDFELESFDVVYGEGLAFVRSVFTLAGLGEKVIRSLLPPKQRRRLESKARQSRTAREQDSVREADELASSS